MLNHFSRRSVYLTLLLALLCANPLSAQFLLPDSESIALMGNRSVCGEIVAFGLTENISSRSSKPRNYFQLDYQQAFLSKLSTAIQISFQKQWNTTAFGFAVNHQGTLLFHTSGLQFAVQKRLLQSLSAGVMIGIQRTNGIEMAPHFDPLLNIQLYHKMTSRFALGFFISNPIYLQSGPKQWSIRYPEIKIGLAYQFKPQIELISELNSVNGSKLSMSSGIRYELDTKLQLQGGIRWIDFSFSAGIHYRFEHFSLQLSYLQHSLPASTPASSLKYQW